MLDKNQKIVADNYQGGEYSYADEVKDPHGRDYGDSLFTFLMTELSYGQDCFTKGDALLRLDNIIEEAEEVKRAFEKLA